MSKLTIFSERLAHARKLSGLSVYDLSVVAGVQPQNIPLWEGGRTPRDPKTMIALARELGVSPTWLAYGEGGMVP